MGFLPYLPGHQEGYVMAERCREVPHCPHCGKVSRAWERWLPLLMGRNLMTCVYCGKDYWLKVNACYTSWGKEEAEPDV